jgi:hypothetical protein
LPVIARIVIEVSRGERDAGVSDLGGFDEIGPLSWAAAASAPGAKSGVKPTPVGQTAHGHAVRPATSLANAGGALEPHPPADMRPIARIKLPHFRSDRHRHPRLP